MRTGPGEDMHGVSRDRRGIWAPELMVKEEGGGRQSQRDGGWSSQSPVCGLGVG